MGGGGKDAPDPGGGGGEDGPAPGGGGPKLPDGGSGGPSCAAAWSSSLEGRFSIPI